MPISVNFYSKKACPLCVEGLSVLKKLAREFSMDIKEIDIYEDDGLLERYQLMIPVVEVGGSEIDYGRLSEDKLRRQLRQFEEKSS